MATERDSVVLGAVEGPWPGSEASWRDAPQITMILVVLSGTLLVCLGVLLGTSWTMLALQPNLRKQAEERRRLNEEWAALRVARGQRSVCPRCGVMLAERSWYIAPTIMEDTLDDDD